jgi:hypothetical protein
MDPIGMDFVIPVCLICRNQISNTNTEGGVLLDFRNSDLGIFANNYCWLGLWTLGLSNFLLYIPNLQFLAHTAKTGI